MDHPSAQVPPELPQPAARWRRKFAIAVENALAYRQIAELKDKVA
jgi:hypothetical protein